MTELSSTGRSVYFSSLGCSKNLVDSQVMLGHLGLEGYQIEHDPQKSEVIIVNTCSFIESAKVESIETILDMAKFKEDGNCKVLVVSGCLAQRYIDQLEQELPEVDLFIGTGQYQNITKYLKAMDEGELESRSFVEIPKYIHTEFDPRMQTTPFYTAWLKVSEGCNRHCTFCIIPTLRGKLRSRSVESLLTECNKMIESGVTEINVISQDLSSYGVDLSTDKNNQLLDLIKGLDSLEGVKWVRLFYYYPDEMSDEVIEQLSKSTKVIPYLDMPIQHFSNSVLKRMNRRVTDEIIYDRVARLRSLIPNLVIRTSVIVGFPGETQEDFDKLLKGVMDLKFDHLGVFKYSDEEGTPAFKLEPKVPQEVIESRFETVYGVQQEILADKQQAWVGKEVEVLVEGRHEETDLLVVGRHYGQAPDIDGKVIINDSNDKLLKIGSFVKVKITEALEYDLIGSCVE